MISSTRGKEGASGRQRLRARSKWRESGCSRAQKAPPLHSRQLLGMRLVCVSTGSVAVAAAPTASAAAASASAAVAPLLVRHDGRFQTFLLALKKTVLEKKLETIFFRVRLRKNYTPSTPDRNDATQHIRPPHKRPGTDALDLARARAFAFAPGAVGRRPFGGIATSCR